ncbi:leucine-rich_repeat domain-containing protein [Hexamita inflata]|uniref:Leucine-rich repeat domain-containing protein n=1 Tax=Hexamita inflata TaxID=28002 RepID=A0AA86QBT5_9EUKA|nr:leucine-rich repeat domain-containing protein [Hexamita inflata]
MNPPYTEGLFQNQDELYDSQMIQKYNKKVYAVMLSILNNKNLRTLSFVDQLPVSELSIDISFNIEFSRVPLNLKKLAVRACNLQDQNNEQNNLSGSKTHDLSQFKYMLSLEHLDLRSNKIQNLNFITPLINLVYLNLQDNKVKDLRPLRTLNLNRLDLERNLISDLQSLNMQSLTALNLNYNQIVSVRPLKRLSNLKILSLSCNQIVDVEPLRTHQFEELYLNDNCITDLEPIKFQDKTIYTKRTMCGTNSYLPLP